MVAKLTRQVARSSNKEQQLFETNLKPERSLQRAHGWQPSQCPTPFNMQRVSANLAVSEIGRRIFSACRSPRHTGSAVRGRLSYHLCHCDLYSGAAPRDARARPSRDPDTRRDIQLMCSAPPYCSSAGPAAPTPSPAPYPLAHATRRTRHRRDPRCAPSVCALRVPHLLQPAAKMTSEGLGVDGKLLRIEHFPDRHLKGHQEACHRALCQALYCVPLHGSRLS